MVRFVASADWQLGMAARTLEPEARARYRQARLDAVREAGRVAAERGAAFLVVAGDVFESDQVDAATIGRALEVLRAVPVPVHLLPGNHDHAGPSSVWASAAFADHRPDHVHVLDTAGPHPVADGVELVAVPWSSKRPTSDLVGDVLDGLRSAPRGDALRVLVGHGQVDALDPDHDRASTIVLDGLRAALDDRLVDLAVLGDRHSLTEVEPRVWYPGTPEVTAHRETDPGHVLVVDLDRDHLAVEPVRVGRWRFASLGGRLESATDVDDLLARLDALPDKERCVARLRLSGVLPLRAGTALEAGLAARTPTFAGLERWGAAGDLVLLPDERDLADLEVGGFVGEVVDDLRTQAASGGSDAATAQDALALLHRLLEAS